jgi:hypothetical protein
MPKYVCKYKPLTKSELANLLEVKSSTLADYLNVKYYDEIVLLGYEKNMKILPPAIVSYLFEKFCITEENL